MRKILLSISKSIFFLKLNYLFVLVARRIIHPLCLYETIACQMNISFENVRQNIYPFNMRYRQRNKLESSIKRKGWWPKRTNISQFINSLIIICMKNNLICCMNCYILSRKFKLCIIIQRIYNIAFQWSTC